jgi:hypothetical protein
MLGLASMLFLQNTNAIISDNNPIRVVTEYSKTAFPLVHGNKASVIYIDSADAEVVHIAGEAFQNDVNLVTGTKPGLIISPKKFSAYPVIIGTLGKSSLIDQIFKTGKLDAKRLTGKWETFIIAVVEKPVRGIEQALVIAGSDRRGTAFGVFELSKLMGVSPWVWWADVTPKHSNSLYVIPGNTIEGPPSVTYRGIFLNDEDWGLKPWAAKHLDTDIQDIGPKTYARIFELMLRLKANYIWTAMHICTKAFYYYPENPKVAEKYAIIVGSSHCEPVLRNNVFEWSLNFEHEYGVKPGEWRYDLNKDQIFKYWDDRAKQSAKFESIYTIGMRGIHDSGMPGGKNLEDKVNLLTQVIQDQRNILSNQVGKPITEIPQIFCPYKEVLTLYRNGLKVPDDITIVWADDNHGYIRQLSNPIEQNRSGRSGVYYHFSYWGSPYDYQWLSTTSPSLTAYEMHKAFQYGADRLWIFNVGDIKPAEMETEFAMELAWNINSWKPDNAYKYAESWAARTFGAEFATPVAAIKSGYYRLAQCGKPEHLGVLNFTYNEMDQRIKDYQNISKEATELAKKIPTPLQDAYYQLILYPVQGAALINEKIFFARKSIELAKNKDKKAIDYSKLAFDAYNQIQKITDTYNNEIAGGKWSDMMSWKPRNLTVFKMPQVATPEMVENFTPNQILPDSNSFVDGKYDVDLVEERVPAATPAKINIPAANFSSKHLNNGESIDVINGLGLDGKGISLFPFTAASKPDSAAAKASYVEYKVKLDAGTHSIIIKALPTHAITKERGVRYAISVNNSPLQVVNLESPAESIVWKQNVLRGYALGQTTHEIKNDTESTVRIYFLDPGVVLNRIEIN